MQSCRVFIGSQLLYEFAHAPQRILEMFMDCNPSIDSYVKLVTGTTYEIDGSKYQFVFVYQATVSKQANYIKEAISSASGVAIRNCTRCSALRVSSCSNAAHGIMAQNNCGHTLTFLIRTHITGFYSPTHPTLAQTFQVVSFLLRPR